MRTQQIRRLIDEGKQFETEHGYVRDELTGLAGKNGQPVSDEEIQTGVQFIVDYVDHAATLIEMIEQKAGLNGVLEEIRPVLAAVEDYFLVSDDLIPDHLGLLGLMDDAYLAHRLIEGIAERYREQLGSNFLPADMAETNAMIRSLVDEPYASMLDDRVKATLNGLSMDPRMQSHEFMQVMEQIGMAFESDPMWSGGESLEIASERLRIFSLH